MITCIAYHRNKLVFDSTHVVNQMLKKMLFILDFLFSFLKI